MQLRTGRVMLPDMDWRLGFRWLGVNRCGCFEPCVNSICDPLGRRATDVVLCDQVFTLTHTFVEHQNTACCVIPVLFRMAEITKRVDDLTVASHVARER